MGYVNEKHRGIIGSPIVIFLAVFALVKPDSLPYIGLKPLENFLIFFDFLLIFLLVLSISYYKISYQSLLVISIFASMTVSTLIHCDQNTNFSFLINSTGPAVAISLLTDYCMQKCPKTFIHIISLTFTILFTINFITIIIFPSGIYQTSRLQGSLWFMGYDNGWIYLLIPYICFSLMHSEMKYGKLFSFYSIYAITLSIVSEFIVFSGTGVMSVLFYFAFLIIMRTKLSDVAIKPKYLLGIFYIGTILIVILRLQNLFKFIIVDYLHKDLTLTGRTYLWDYALSVIKSNLILGVGECGYTVVGLHGSYLHPHCLILDLLYKGGIIMFSLFNILIFKFSKNIKKYSWNIYSKILLISVGSFLFSDIVNSGQYKPFLWCLLVMSAYLSQIIEKDTKQF